MNDVFVKMHACDVNRKRTGQIDFFGGNNPSGISFYWKSAPSAQSIKLCSSNISFFSHFPGRFNAIIN